MPTAFFWIAASSDEDIAQVVLFLIFVLIAVVARLVKKAAQASKPPSVGGGRPTPRVGGGASQPRVPSLSDFLRRIKEVSGEAEKPTPPHETEPERPQPRTAVPTPAPPRRPTFGTRQPTRPVSIPQPSLRPKRETETRRGEPLVTFQRQTVETLEPAAELRPLAEALPRLEATLKTTRGIAVSTPQSLSAGLAETPTHEPYPIVGHVLVHLGDILGGAISASELRKGIILSEILGRPKALRVRRPTVRRKVPG